ncbi:Peptidyl-prolyl cis-trans isomerase cyp15 [Coemansia asiatica]|uniref:peptidylprolyl isomerase n=1 Tax=Coemansia asiatica TaxID=1052880 RepID=A0A9W7XFC2_9FUNG|nr:Peptidyl-prolyl cis-trans isomerase cyp15 [Coemansia asiatica]
MSSNKDKGKRKETEDLAANVSSESNYSNNSAPVATQPAKRIATANNHEKRQLERLPCAEMYERSYMHRDLVDRVVATKSGFVLTLSADGHVKFWKKSGKGIEFVKDFRAHLSAPIACTLSSDGQLFATVSMNKQIKVFDVINFDMIGIVSIDFIPSTICWIVDPLDQSMCIAVADSSKPDIYILDPYSTGASPKKSITNVHRQPIQLMAYNQTYKCMLSIDRGGMVEYWSLNDDPHKLPSSIGFSLKSQTDLYEFKKRKYVPTSLAFSPDNELFVCTSPGNATICVFRFATGKIYRKYDESASACNAIQQKDETGRFQLDDMEFGRRLAVENELVKAPAGRNANAVFDESSDHLLFTSLFGIKVVNLSTNKVSCVLGKSEPYRFTNIALIQSTLESSNMRFDLATSKNPAAKVLGLDPILFCTAFKKNRFFIFTREEPDHTEQGADRDIFNEKPTREEASLAVASKKKKIARSAVLRTTLGDIHLSLFPELAPKAVESFAVHSQNGYYNGVIFHRVIKRFMIQTGDPLGDGTGGESIWKMPFEDEFTPKLRHDRPYTLSMANAGPGTNGSQFFITTVDSAPWLDDKHTIFGRVKAGADVVHAIESAKTDKNDKPFDDISIMNIQINYD